MTQMAANMGGPMDAQGTAAPRSIHDLSGQGEISGRLGVGAAGASLSTNASNEWLTRLTVRELVRLSLRTENPVTGTTLSREQIEALSFYAEGRQAWHARGFWIEGGKASDVDLRVV